MENMRFFIFIGIASLIFAFITFLLGIYFRKKRFIKYIPSILILILGVSFLVKSVYFSNGFEDIGYMVLSLMSVGVFIISTLTALLIEFVFRSKRKKRQIS